MERTRSIKLAKIGVLLGVVPVLLWAYEYGPNPGYVGVPADPTTNTPAENVQPDGSPATCAAVGCHTGPANNPANKGSVTVAFPNGMTYTPGVKQHLIVTIADPATTQTAWGFELTARQSSSPSTMAGSFTPSDTQTQVMCSQPNLFVFQPVCLPGADPTLTHCMSPSSTPACPAGFTLQYAEHSLNGFQTTVGHASSGTYGFDWTPPSSNVGNVVIYVAGNAGLAVQPLSPSGAHIYTNTYTLTPAAAMAPPAVNPTLGVQNQTSAPSAAGVAVAPGSLVAIYGSNFATAPASASSIPLSTQLANVSVTFAGVPAPMVGIAPGLKVGSQTVDQINAIVPWEVTPGAVPVVVTNTAGASTPVNLSIAAAGPGIFYIATDSTQVNRPLAYNNSDNTFAYPSGIFGSNLNSRPASIANDILVIWCTGLGAVTVQPPDGAPATNASGQFVESDTVTKPVVMVGGRQATVLFSGLTQYPSIYQVNVKLDASTPTGDAVPLQIQMDGGPLTIDQLKIAVTK
jgi:uncharacterized protein (TIGR03437 family)